MAAPRAGSINDPAPGPSAGRPPDAIAKFDPVLLRAVLIPPNPMSRVDDRVRTGGVVGTVWPWTVVTDDED